MKTNTTKAKTSNEELWPRRRTPMWNPGRPVCSSCAALLLPDVVVDLLAALRAREVQNDRWLDLKHGRA